jgi:alpha-beta hydrolase superfamily lysophospholipase
MLRLLKWAGTLLLVLVLGVTAAVLLGPVTQVDLASRFKSETIGADLDVWLEEQEQAFPGIVPGTEKQVIWAGAEGEKTPTAIVYLHGFSGSSVDIKPVPDLAAEALGANLFYTRLTGHGLGGPALGAATPEAWIDDTAEALAIGRRLGDRVLVIATSTGGTLATMAMADPDVSQDVAGLVLISPNFRMKSTKARILDLGYAPVWAPWLMGPEYSTTPTSQAHETYWTTSYPTSALFHVAALIRAALTIDPTTIEVPLLVLYSPNDQVVEQARTVSFLEDWGGPIRWEPREMTDQDDPNSHMITGDIRSPSQSTATVATILDWAEGFEK